MLRKTLVLIPLGLVTALVAVGLYARSRGAMLPWVGGTSAAQVVDRMITGDSTAVAELALDRCRFLRNKTRQHCYEELLLGMVEKSRVRLAMDGLSVLSRIDPGTVRNGHDLAHVVGINAWTPGKDVSTVYETCTALYQSGCYHGVVQAYLDANGTDSATVFQLCHQIKVNQTDMWLRFQCVHGIGHGLVNALNHHLPKALRGCDQLVDSWDAQSCYGGAFMEFIVAGRGQSHHPSKHHAAGAATPAAADEHDHGDHGDHDAAAAPQHDHAAALTDSFAFRDRTDPLYPCTAIDTKYQFACYGMQAGIIIELTGPDFGKIAAACDEAPDALKSACYQGIGTYVSGYTVRNHEKSIELCAKGNARLQAWCYVGVVKNFVDVTSAPDDGFAFCARFADRNYGVACYNAVGEEMNVLYRNTADRERQCAKLPTDPAAVCRYGAGLGGPRPKELDFLNPAA